MGDHDVHRTQQHDDYGFDELLLLRADCPFPESSSDVDKEEHQVLHLLDFSPPRVNYRLQLFSEYFVDAPGASANNCTYNELHVAGLKATSTAVFTFVKIHLLWCMAIGGVCNLSMAYYLFRHIRSRTREGFAASGSQGQKQVAVSEFVQTVLFFICIMLYFALTFDYANQFIFGPLLYLTVLLLYMTGTTASLAIGQAIFRQGAVDVWKALTALCCASV